jgi:hypothetical protein
MRPTASGPSTATEFGLLAVILAAYLAVGAAFAIYTPPWQAPDEPAHYNYVAYVAENGRLPELAAGDYPLEYLEALKAARFPADMPIDTIRYESHQPPLYYILASGVYRLANKCGWPTLLALRLFSLLLGGLSIMVGYAVLRAILPARREIALGATALAAFLPMHLATLSAVNNDALVELLIALVAWGVLRPGPIADRWRIERTGAIGLALGLAVLTKMQSYPAFAVAFGALIWDTWPRADGSALPWRTAIRRGALMLGLAALVALPWLLRNMSIYGWGDPLALRRHDAVVAGQLTTAQYVAENGRLALLRAFALTTFRSFWGQFGWMGVVLDARVYAVFAMLSALAAGGIAIGIYRLWQIRHRLNRLPWRAIALLATWAAATVAGYLWWNTRFLQHQGRYLFPALLPIALGTSIGLSIALRWPPALIGALATGVVGLACWGWARGDLPLLAMAYLIAAMAYLWIGRRMERLCPGSALLASFIVLAPSALVLLVTQIVPALRP